MLSYAAVPTALRGCWPLAAALLITAFGALLRLDAFTQKYGTLDHPAWARVATHDAAALASRLRPAHIKWGRYPRPYVGGDPINYLQYAREMETFYQPHVREPIFLAATHLALRSLDDQDAAVSLASAAGSVLAIFATYLLAAVVLGRGTRGIRGSTVGASLWALAAALLMAIEYENISWSVDGWRDDWFTAAFALTAWALVRLYDRASFGNALLAGFLAGVACLTRITALSFIVPALGWLAVAAIIENRGSSAAARKAIVGRVAVAAAILAALVAPYLISCAIASGDPFLAINYHTSYYRFAEGLPIEEPMSVADYITRKAADHPVATIDVGAAGLLVRPFQTKWAGFDLWLPGLGSALACASLAGLAIWVFSPRGRLMILLLVTSLLPYAFTWNLGGGGEWRFTMHAYPIYLVAVVYAGAAVLATEWRASIREVGRRAVSVAAIAATAAAIYISMPWFVAREALAKTEAVTIGAGARDRVFFRGGWSPPRQEGAITTRTSLEPQTRMHFPLPERRDYEVVLRLDPVASDRQRRMMVLFNRQLIASLQLAWDPARVGSYRLSIPAWRTRRGENEITLVPETMVTAGSAGERFASLDPAQQLGVRFWYLRILE